MTTETHSVLPGTLIRFPLGRTLLRALAPVARFARADSATPFVLVDLERDRGVMTLRFVATDGFALAVSEVADESGELLADVEQARVLIPATTVPLMLALLKRAGDTTVLLDLSESRVELDGGDRVEWQPVRDVVAPEWRIAADMTRAEADAPPFRVTSAYIVEVVRAFKAAGAESILIASGGEGQPVHYTSQDAPGLFVTVAGRERE